MTSITPTKGSSSGGTLVVITGDGFNQDTTLVQVGQQFYTKDTGATISYNQISFVTRGNSDTQVEIVVYVNDLKADCTIAGVGCNYEFASNVAPFISSISPLSIADQSNVTLSGYNFGNDKTKLSVTIGSQACNIVDANNQTIFCTLPGLELGKQNVNVNLAGYFTFPSYLCVDVFLINEFFFLYKGVGNSLLASSNLTVTGLANLKSITPASGSIYGGTRLIIAGNGFSQSKTTVSIGTSSCTITLLTSFSIECLTPQNNLGTYKVQIMFVFHFYFCNF